jgi:hypothetical protein
LHTSITSSLPALKPTDQPEKIADHQQAMAQKIREARPYAKRGDIFSKEARKAFRRTSLMNSEARMATALAPQSGKANRSKRFICTEEFPIFFLKPYKGLRSHAKTTYVVFCARAEEFKFPLRTGSVKFAAIGDMGTEGAPQYEVEERMNTERQRFPFDLVITLGDGIYGRSHPKDFERKFDRPYKALLDASVKRYGSLANTIIRTSVSTNLST